MEITVEKIAMIRENYNPKNTNLNLDVDWSVEYTNTDQREINYNIVLRSAEYLNLNFKVEGLLKLDIFEEFVQQECSQIVFHHACTFSNHNILRRSAHCWQHDKGKSRQSVVLSRRASFVVAARGIRNDRRIGVWRNVCVGAWHGHARRHDLPADVHGLHTRLFPRGIHTSAGLLQAKPDDHIFISRHAFRQAFAAHRSVVLPLVEDSLYGGEVLYSLLYRLQRRVVVCSVGFHVALRLCRGGCSYGSARVALFAAGRHTHARVDRYGADYMHACSPRADNRQRRRRARNVVRRSHDGSGGRQP